MSRQAQIRPGLLKQLHRNLHRALQTWHGRFVLAGLTVGLVYLPAWLPELVVRAAQGSAGLPLISAAVFLALRYLWKHRHALAQQHASEEDQILGHLLIAASVGLVPFVQFAVWSQAMVWLLALAGIACSSWGGSFFVRHPLPTILMVLTVYPKPGVMARLIWQSLTPPAFLEQVMANAGALALQTIGQPAIAQGTFVVLPAGAVDVDWGCNGFNMAFTIAATGLIMGLFLKQSAPKVAVMMIVGAILALIANVPRIMLLTFAAVYWGEAAFKFWHGHWGGQIFSGVLFTVYYYAVMALIPHRSAKNS
jgi:exosortase